MFPGNSDMEDRWSGEFRKESGQNILFLHEQTEYESSDVPFVQLGGHIDYKNI